MASRHITLLEDVQVLEQEIHALRALRVVSGKDLDYTREHHRWALDAITALRTRAEAQPRSSASEGEGE